jgi:hypothetical protein
MINEPRRFAIQKHAVLVFAVIAEAFTVIRQQDDRVVVQVLRAQVRDQLSDDVVRGRNLGVTDPHSECRNGSGASCGPCGS